MNYDVCGYFHATHCCKQFIKIRNSAAICKLVEQTPHMDGKPVAVLEIRRIVKRIKKLRVHHCRKEVERSVRGRYYNKKGGLSIAQCIKVYVVRVRKVCDFRKIERRKPHSRRN